jgi:general secretion pathway protein D
MKTKFKFIVLTGFMAVFSLTLKADPATPDPAPNGSAILTNMRLEIEKDTDTVHLISTVNDPDIITKTYVLKHADPYELRPYLRTAVGAEMITGGDSWVECIKYNDGTGILIVSAEDYRFNKEELKKHGGGEECMCIDEIVEQLDQPKITSSSGSARFIYFPEYRSAQEIANMAVNVGINLAGDTTELMFGADAQVVDPGLNAVIFYSPKYNVKNIEEMVEVYDRILPEAKVEVKVFEIGYENDTKIGVDFQAWKNGPGSDLFSAAARFAQGMSTQGIPNATGWGSTKYIQLSPRWNSRFIDFLTAKGKAKTVVEATLIIRNNEQGYLENTTRVSNFTDGTPIADRVLLDYEELFGNWRSWGTAGLVVDGGFQDYTFRAFDAHGAQISINAAFRGSIRIGRIADNGDGTTPYTLQIIQGTGAFFIKDGKNLGTRINECYNLELLIDAAGPGVVFTDWAPYVSVWQTDKNMVLQKNFQRDTQLSSYGFQMTITPTVCVDTTVLALNMQNTSLLGFTENADGAAGAARTSRSEVNTRLMVNNQNQRFMIGGIEKTSLVRSTSKVPWLGSLPIIGYLLGSESTVVKKSQLVTVITCQHQTPDTTVPAKIYGDVRKLKKALKKAPKHYNLGFDQFLLDPKKTSLDSLP